MMTDNGPNHVATVIGQLSQGGSEKQLFRFLEHCDRTRWSPIVYVSGGEIGFWEDQVRALNIPIVVLNGSPLRRMLTLRRSFIKNDVRCFFSWASHTNVYGLAIWDLKIRRIGSFRNIYGFDLPERHRWLREWANLAGINIAVCNSKETAAVVEQHIGRHKQVVYIPNSVEPAMDTARFRQMWRERLGIEDNDVLVLGVGRLAPQKNFSRFIAAVASAYKKTPLKAVVAGRDDGCLRDLQDQVAATGLPPNTIRFIGAVPDARELMCAADMFVLSSDFEGMPNVMLEALSVGVPCVSTRVNGVNDLIEDGVNGFITDQDVDALAARISALAANPEQRQKMSAQAAKRISGVFAPQVVARTLWQVCEGDTVSPQMVTNMASQD